MGFAKVISNPDLMWYFETEPEANLNGRKISAMRGKVLGGSSSVNGMIYVRGLPSDFSVWRQLGAVGWNYDDVLPYFRKAQRQSRGADRFHGDGGRVGVEDSRWKNSLADAFLDASAEAGIPLNPDICGESAEGMTYYQTTSWKGRRTSTALAYLKPARGRANLEIATGALVTKIELAEREATGVLYERNGQVFRAKARREVVLSAGSFATPQLLQLSGVGPGALLQQFGIPTVHELPGVGENMMDHIIPKRTYTTSSRDTFNAVMSGLASQAIAGMRYIFTRTGPMTVGAALAGGYARSRPDVSEPDLQIFYMPFAGDDYTGQLQPESSFQLCFYQCRPESRGHLRIQSTDPREAPKIVANYFSSPKDEQVVLDGLRLIGRIGDAEPLARMGAVETKPTLTEETDAALMDYARSISSTAYHFSGTCRMGDPNEKMVVVDPQLKVRGINKLRIADGSVMPAISSGNTNSICMMIGEKCADMILQDQ